MAGLKRIPPRPPLYLRWTLRLLLDRQDRRIVLSDLDELYARRRARQGEAAADAWYRRQARQYPWRLLAERLRAGGRDHRALAQPGGPRRARAGETMHGLLKDLRSSLRSLIKTPDLTTTIVLTVGLGIAGTATVFSAVYAVLLKPLPYPEPGRLVRIYSDHPPHRWPLSVVDYNAIREQQTHFRQIAAYWNTTLTFHQHDLAEGIEAQMVTPGYFSLLGLRPLLGRGFVDGDAVPGTAPAAVVSHRFWRRRLGADPAALGQPISLDGRDYTVVGVLPPDTGPLQEGREVFAVLQLEPPQRKGPFFLRVLGRLAPGAQVTAARAELHAINRRLFPIWRASYPDATVSYGVESLHQHVVGDVGRPLLILLGAVAFVWLVASTNAASLLVARGTRRSRELAVRSALGASRRRLLRQLLAESTLLAAAGAVLGLAIAAAAVRLLSTLGAELLPRAAEVAVSGPVLGLIAGLTLGSLLLFGLVPALQVTGSDFEQALQAGGRTATGGARSQRVRRALVASQLAVAVPLLAAAGLLMASFVKLQRVDPGFPSGNLLTLALPLAEDTYADRGVAGAFWRQAVERVAALPGVTAAGMGTGRPPAEYPEENNFNLLDRPTPPEQTEPTCPWMTVDREYFRTLGVPLVRGRLFAESDRDDDAPVAILVDQSWARRFYPGEEVVGRKLTSGGCNGPECTVLTVVGVVGDVKYTGLDDPGRGVVYLAQSQVPFRSGYLFVRTATDPFAVLPAIRSVLGEMDPALPVTQVATMEELLRDDLSSPRSYLALIGGFAAVALLLAVVGIYGVMSYYVEQHAREIGIRIAIGGEPGSVLRLMLGRGMRLAAVGIVVGLAGALALTRFMSGLLYQVSPTDGRTLASVLVLLGVTAFLACLLPARRAARVDPTATLRLE